MLYEVITIKRAASSGVDMIHFDVMDGQFVPNISFGLPVLESIKACTDLPIDVHLMIKNPYDYIEKFAAAGADIITFHVEAESDIGLTIELIHSFGLKAGVSINVITSYSIHYTKLYEDRYLHPTVCSTRLRADELDERVR